MSNQDLYRTWVERYAQRIKQPQQNPSGTSPSTPDPTQQSPVTLPPAPIGTYSFLQNQFGEQFLREYNKKVKKDYADAPALKVLSWNDTEKVVVGSNPFAIVLINEMLNPQGIRTVTQSDLEHIVRGNLLHLKGHYPQGIRTVTQSDLEHIVRGNLLHLKGHYEESALVWRSNGNPNTYLATKIYNQFKSLGKILEENHAYVLPLNAFSLEKDTNAPQGLAFQAGRKSIPTLMNIYFEAPILMRTSGKYISDTDFDLTRGLPTQVFDSAKSVLIPNRQLYTRDSGLSRLYLNRNLVVNSSNVDLAYSDDDGRVVLVSGAAATQKNAGGTS